MAETDYSDTNNIRNLQLTMEQVQYVTGMRVCRAPLTETFDVTQARGMVWEGMNLWIGDGSDDDKGKTYYPETEEQGEQDACDGINMAHRTELLIDAAQMGLSIGDEFIFNGAVYGLPPIIRLVDNIRYVGDTDYWMHTNYYQTEVGKRRFKVVSNSLAYEVGSDGSGYYSYDTKGDYNPHYVQADTGFVAAANNPTGEMWYGIDYGLNKEYTNVRRKYKGLFYADTRVSLVHENGFGYTKEEIPDALAALDGTGVNFLDVVYHTKQSWANAPSPPSTEEEALQLGGDTIAEANQVWEDIKAWADAQDVACAVKLIPQVCNMYIYFPETDTYEIGIYPVPYLNGYKLYIPNGYNANFIKRQRDGNISWFDTRDLTTKLFNCWEGDYYDNFTVRDATYPDPAWYIIPH